MNANPESVSARLLNEARRIGEDYQITLMRYLLERFLCRLAVSNCRDAYVLKGAMLFRIWENLPYRTTMDLDLLRNGTKEGEALRKEIQAICTANVEPDAVRFDSDSVMVEPIRVSEEYKGQRVMLMGFLGRSRTRLQIDIGMGDLPWPLPSPCEYPTLLGAPPLWLAAYRRESVIAEKLEAMVILGLSNSRIKDFFDLHHLAMQHAFQGDVLAEAIRRTFDRRKTPIPSEPPIALSDDFWKAKDRANHIRAFARKGRIQIDAASGERIAPMLRSFLWPPLEALSKQRQFQENWIPGGPWK